jgi:hypothetical protein
LTQTHFVSHESSAEPVNFGIELALEEKVAGECLRSMTEYNYLNAFVKVEWLSSLGELI